MVYHYASKLWSVGRGDRSVVITLPLIPVKTKLKQGEAREIRGSGVRGVYTRVRGVKQHVGLLGRNAENGLDP